MGKKKVLKKKAKTVKKPVVKNKMPVVKRKTLAKKANGKNYDSLIAGLEKQSADLTANISQTRQGILDNESALKEELLKKAGLEDRLNSALKENFSNEKETLEKIMSSAEKEEADLKEKVSCLQRITKIYDEKKSSILETKKRQLFLKKQLEKLENQAREWS